MKIKLCVKEEETGKVLEDLGTCICDSPSRAVQMYNQEEKWQEKGYDCDIYWEIIEEVQPLADTLALMRSFAEEAADAYVNQYLGGHVVMNNPIVAYNKATGKFSWQSSLTPLSDNEVEVERLEEGIYGDTSDDAEAERQNIIDYIMSSMDASELMEKIESED